MGAAEGLQAKAKATSHADDAENEDCRGLGRHCHLSGRRQIVKVSSKLVRPGGSAFLDNKQIPRAARAKLLGRRLLRRGTRDDSSSKDSCHSRRVNAQDLP